MRGTGAFRSYRGRRKRGVVEGRRRERLWPVWEGKGRTRTVPAGLTAVVLVMEVPPLACLLQYSEHRVKFAVVR